MNLQERTLKQYMQLRDQPCLREIAEETGIQQTRVFRILNGAKMRLDEWEIFNKIVDEADSDLEKLARDCLKELSIDQLSLLQKMMKDKLDWKRSIDQAHKNLARA
tara:strand:- start:258 stop:575 length:318 start_codon:yes stop_codon:yes gene_type:complete